MSAKVGVFKFNLSSVLKCFTATQVSCKTSRLILCGLYCAALPGTRQQLVGDDTTGRRQIGRNRNHINMF